MIADVWTWFHFWLILHILAVIIAFGPSFSYGLIASLGQKHPEHGAFAVEVIETLERRVSIPLAVVVPFLGLALIYTGHFDLWKSEWLVISIGLYIVAFFFAVTIQLRTVANLLRALRALPPGPPPPGATPPPEVTALGKRAQLGGMFLGILVVAIAILMVWRPGSCQGIC